MKSLVYSIFLMVLLCITGKTSAQPVVPVDEETKKITYKEVVKQEGTAEKLYNLAISWINSFYANPTDVTRVRDVTNGKIEVRHRIEVWNVDKNGNKTTRADVVEYTMTLEFKEGRYRYIITDFNVKRVSKYPLERWLDKNDPDYSPACENYLKQIDEEVKNIIKNLKEGIKPKVQKDDNW